MDNTLEVVGEINSIELSHTYTSRSGFTSNYYKGIVSVERLSGLFDNIPVIIPDKFIQGLDLKNRDYVKITGQVRTHNYTTDDGKNHLAVNAYVSDIEKLADEDFKQNDTKNYVKLEGILCKKPTLRETNSGRVISDVLIAHNRKSYDGVHCKSDYIPTIFWGTNAKMASHFNVGDHIEIEGRFQSRDFYRASEEENIKHTTYEISVSNFVIIDDNKNDNEKSEQEA